MKRIGSILAAAVYIVALLGTPSGASAFALKDLDATFTGADGSPQMQAGSHPFAATTTLAVEEEEDPALGKIPAGQVRELRVELPPGFTGSPFATPRCEGVDFASFVQIESGLRLPDCSNSSVVGLVAVEGASGENVRLALRAPLYNLVPPPGVAAKFGFFVPLVNTPVTIEAQIKEDPPYNLIAKLTDTTQTVRFFNSVATLWGNPSDPSHDTERGRCGFFFKQGLVEAEPGGSCPTSNPNRPFLTLPRSCTGPLPTVFEATSWLGDTFKETIETHGASGEPLGIVGCSQLGFGPALSIAPTNQSASSPTGLDVHLDIHDEGLTDPNGLADSDIQKAVVTLPKGVTINPSQAEGLGVCSEVQLAAERPASQFGAGCPAASKIGTVEVETPLLEGTILKGSLFVAEPYTNRFGSLIALYMTIAEPKLGVIFKLAGKVEPDPKTGQLITTFDELPQQPFSHFRLHFREGGRSPLITPPSCGTYTTEAQFTPTSDPSNPFKTSSSFEVSRGPGGGPCPPPGTPPFEPGFVAGSINNAAGQFSPFYMRLTRRDGDQDMTHFSAKLPPGVLAKLAGASRCPEAQIALAKAKTGKAELTSPSCPANSQIGRTLAGAGVGAQLTYVAGKVYLAGPYHGAPLSVAAIVPAVAGPFDVGTVVVREALRVDPRTGEVLADGAASDPIPHILAGIPLAVREIEVYVDRPNFTINPTGCKPSQTTATLFGSFADVFDPADDVPVSLASPFHAADCQNLGFKPALALKLKGGTKRGAHPALTGTYTPRAGDANLADLVLRLPHSAFLDQAHIRTICTRVQFAQKACPEGAVYGHATAYTPLLDEPLSGPVYLRSSNHNLPDFVASLHGLIDVEAVARIDSVKGGIRATFNEVPDAPLSKVVVQMQGAKKGLIVNSTDLCAAKHRAAAQLSGHNGKAYQARPVLRASCGGGHGRKKRHGKP
jgi:hypothetical protein